MSWVGAGWGGGRTGDGCRRYHTLTSLTCSPLSGSQQPVLLGEIRARRRELLLQSPLLRSPGVNPSRCQGFAEVRDILVPSPPPPLLNPDISSQKTAGVRCASLVGLVSLSDSRKQLSKPAGSFHRRGLMRLLSGIT